MTLVHSGYISQQYVDEEILPCGSGLPALADDKVSLWRVRDVLSSAKTGRILSENWVTVPSGDINRLTAPEKVTPYPLLCGLKLTDPLVT